MNNLLAELSIKNFAIIEEINVSFTKGLTVLSGETGAGKSIIIDTIGLLVGGRGSAEFVRHGTDKAEIEGIFYLEKGHPCIQKCAEFGIELEDDMILLKRDITSNGKSVCRINGRLITTSILKEVGKLLVDIHGQHEHQDLMNPERHLAMLDQFNKDKIAKQLHTYQNVYGQYEKVKKELKDLSENEQQMAHRLDLIQFQLEEITSAALEIDEDTKLLEERMKISNFERIHLALQNAYQSLSGDSQGLDSIRVAMNQLETISSLDAEIEGVSESVASSYYHLEEISYTLREKLDMMEYDPARLDIIETRLNDINMLKRKYGETIEEILGYGEKIAVELDTIENKDEHILRKKHELKELSEKMVNEARTLSQLRKKTGLTLTEAIHKELQELYMEKTVFEVRITEKAGNEQDPCIDGKHVKPTRDGMDDVEFYISTNPGEPLKPLAKTASGGELSRIILALKSLFSQHQGVTSIIFDEVDTGVSGRVAQAIAEKIYRVSVGSQVLCITHLPQVASMADTHLFITKEIVEDRTKTNVIILKEDKKIAEIARMISGAEITDLTHQHAKELIHQAEKLK